MIKNPILPGFNPDPSICRVNQDYYIATSTFEWYPGITIYHSKNLVQWELIARPVSNMETIQWSGTPDSNGLWAPHLSYDKGVFYLVITDVKNTHFFKDTPNYVMTAKSIEGPWTKPQYLNSSGFDPALFHDDDGKHYLLNMMWDYRIENPNFNGILLQEIESDTLKLIGERQCIYENEIGHVIEGSQVIKRNGYYYLICAEGGTGYNHSTTILRSTNIRGPYEKSPYWPLLTARHLPDSQLQKAGHSGIVAYGAEDEEWYMTFLCARPLTERGYCPLGRETAIARLKWIDDWPRLDVDGEISYKPPMFTKKPHGKSNIEQVVNRSIRTTFDTKELPNYLYTLRGPLEEEKLFERSGYLRLYGKHSPRSLFKQSIIARRCECFDYRVETSLEFNPTNFQQMAGLILYYNTENWYYVFVTYNEQLSSRVISIITANRDCFDSSKSYKIISEDVREIRLALRVEQDKGQFLVGANQEGFESFGPILDVGKLSDDYIEEKGLVFTGLMVGICAQDMDRQLSYADFKYLDYQEKN